jgi:hypothetical protein
MCVDYRKLNDITCKDKNPLLLIQDIFDTLFEATVDLPNAYHLIQIKEQDKWMTAIKMPFGVFEYNIIPFGLCNAPAVFQHFMNHVLQDLIAKCCMVYLDDIIIFSRNQTEHEEHLRAVFEKLCKNLLHINPAKFQFFRSSIAFLEHTISHQSIQIDPSKTLAIQQRPPPSNLKELQSFLGLTNYYHKFIPNYSDITLAFRELLSKKNPFKGTTEHSAAFKQLKLVFSTMPFLLQFDASAPIVVKTNASNYAISAILCQPHPYTHQLHSVVYYSHFLQGPELITVSNIRNFCLSWNLLNSGVITSFLLLIRLF